MYTRVRAAVECIHELEQQLNVYTATMSRHIEPFLFANSSRRSVPASKLTPTAHDN